MKHTYTTTLKPAALAALLIFALPVGASQHLSGSYETINTPDGFTMSTGDTVTSALLLVVPNKI